MDKIQRTLHEEWVRSQPDRDLLVIAMKNVESLLQEHHIIAGDEHAAKNGLETCNAFLRQHCSLDPNHVKVGFLIITKMTSLRRHLWSVCLVLPLWNCSR